MGKNKFIKPKMKYNPMGKYEVDLPKKSKNKEPKIKLNIKWWMIVSGIVLIAFVIYLFLKI